MTTLDQFSLVTVPIELFFDETWLGQGTGFVWREANRNYLVTNWHVLSGRDFFNGKCLHEMGGIPNRISTMFTVETGIFDKRRWDLHILDDDGKPLWLAYPGGKRVDIVVLPLSEPSLPMTMYPINELAKDDLRVEIGMDVFILGYPFKIGPPGLPVWKRGSIASEPEIVRITTDYMLVDTASRPGMSGSPVIRRSWTNHMTVPGIVAHLGQPMNRFLGVYSGRVPTDHPNEAQIGLVWDGSLIREIIVGGMQDT